MHVVKNTYVMKVTFRSENSTWVQQVVVRLGESLPYRGDDGTGLGKPLKPIVHPLRSHIPIYMGAEGPKNIALATEIADGWLPLFYNPYDETVYAESLTNMRADFARGVPLGCFGELRRDIGLWRILV